MNTKIITVLFLVTTMWPRFGQGRTNIIHSNVVESIDLSDYWMLRIGRWEFGAPGYVWPFPVVITCQAYLDTYSSEEDGQTVLKEIKNLKHEDRFITMCGDFAHIGILNKKEEWIAFVRLNADAETVIISDNAYQPTNMIVTTSSMLCSNVFRMMWEYNPDLVRQRMRNNECVSNSYLAIYNHLESTHQAGGTNVTDVQQGGAPYSSPAAGSESGDL